jgi:hypothetical protein
MSNPSMTATVYLFKSVSGTKRKSRRHLQNVVIADDRPAWIKEEDKVMTCMTRCSLYKKCASRMGPDCKKLGGSEIPKLRG